MRYLFGFLAAVALIVVVFILIVRGFGGRSPNVQAELTDYAPTQTVMRLTIEGPVNAEQSHRSAIISVGRESNTINLNQGYEGRVLKTQTYQSNETAYATFLRALQLQGYTKGDDSPAKADYRGFCPTGRIYIFEIVTGSASVQKFWTTSCGGGTFKGNHAVIRKLFKAQIPDYIKITAGNGLN